MKIRKICSNCGNEFEYEYKFASVSNSNICPICGKKATDIKKNFKTNNKAFVFKLLLALLTLAIVIVFWATDLSAMILNAKEYKAYKYAIECVQNELTYPDTATYPSFKKSTVKTSKYTTEIILNSYKGNGFGKGYDQAWDISGAGTVENAFGMTMNYRFTVTVVSSENGDLWCYECLVN